MAKKKPEAPAASPMIGGGHMVSGPKRHAKKRPHVRIERSNNGGFSVDTGHTGGDGMTYESPQNNVFGPDQHEEMIGHVRKHLGINRKAAAAPRKGKPFGSAAETEPDGDE